MWRALASVGEQVLADPAVRVVLLRGAGASFSAGLDRAMVGEGSDEEPGLAALGRLPAHELDAVIARFQQAFTWWRDPRIVSIAAVQGHAVGAGFQLALACHLRVLADDASLSMREIRLGLVPDLAGTKPLVDLVGPSRALDLCVTGRWVAAEEALSMGLTSSVVPLAELDAASRGLAQEILSAAPGAVRAVTGLLDGAGARSHEEQQARERDAQVGRLRDLLAAEGGG